MKTSDYGLVKMRFSVVIPVFNEKDSLEVLYARLTNVMQNLEGTYEIIFVDDGSTDGSFQILKDLHQKDNNIKVIRFTRNFGQHIAITAGLDYCKGENIIVMDADLQDQPEEIPKLLAKLRQGYDIVYGLRRKRQDNLFKRIGSKTYLALLSKLTSQVVNREITPFRIMTRRVVDWFIKFSERNRFYSGLVAWLGFPYAVVDVEHGERFAGMTTYSLWKMTRLAMEGVVSFSDLPLRLIGHFGLIVSAVSFVIGARILIKWILWGIPVAGYTSTIVSVFFLGGVVLTVLGVLGRYIGKIHSEVKHRPMYVTRDLIE